MLCSGLLTPRSSCVSGKCFILRVGISASFNNCYSKAQRDRRNIIPYTHCEPTYTSQLPASSEQPTLWNITEDHCLNQRIDSRSVDFVSRSASSRLGQDKDDISSIAFQLDNLMHDAVCNRHLLRMICNQLDHLLVPTRSTWSGTNTAGHPTKVARCPDIDEMIGDMPHCSQIGAYSSSESSMDCESDTEACLLSAAASEITLPSPRVRRYEARGSLRSKSLEVYTTSQETLRSTK